MNYPRRMGSSFWYHNSNYRAVIYERELNSVRDKLCGSKLTHVEHSKLYLSFWFCNYLDTYLSKSTNKRPMRSTYTCITNSVQLETLHSSTPIRVCDTFNGSWHIYTKFDSSGDTSRLETRGFATHSWIFRDTYEEFDLSKDSRHPNTKTCVQHIDAFAIQRRVCNATTCLQHNDVFATHRRVCNTTTCLQRNDVFATQRCVCTT